MFNELLFLVQNIVIAACSVGCLFLGGGALTAFISICWIAGNLFVLKQATLFGMPVVTSDVFIVGANLGIGLLRHYFGNKDTERAIWTASACSFFFMIMSLFLLAYIPNSFDTTSAYYAALLTPIPRLVITSFIVAIISAYLHIWLYNKFSVLTNKRYLYAINMGALLLSQLADTVLFGFFGMYGLVHSIIPIMAFSFTIKTICIFVCTPLISINYSRFFKKIS